MLHRDVEPGQSEEAGYHMGHLAVLGERKMGSFFLCCVFVWGFQCAAVCACVCIAVCVCVWCSVDTWERVDKL